MPTNNAWNSQDPAQVAKGGTGRNQFTELNQLIIGGAIPTDPLQQVPNGIAGQLLISNGPGVAPSWGDAPPATCLFNAYNSGGQDPNATNNNYYIVGSTPAYPYIVLQNIGGNFNAVTGMFTPPVNGFYQIFGGVTIQTINAATSTNVKTVLYTGAPPPIILFDQVQLNGLNTIYLIGSVFVPLTAGVPVGLAVYPVSDGNILIVSPGGGLPGSALTTYFGGFLVLPV